MSFLEPFLFVVDECFKGEIILMDGRHLKVQVFVLDVPIFAEISFGSVALRGFVRFSSREGREGYFCLTFLFLHLNLMYNLLEFL